MKHLSILALAILTLSVFVATADAKNNKPVDKSLDRDLIIENLMNGVCSDNLGLRMSSAYLLGEFEAKEAVIPLMRILKQCDDENERIMAALSLYKIGTGKSIYAVERAGIFDDSERVRTICKNLYYDFLLNRQ